MKTSQLRGSAALVAACWVALLAASPETRAASPWTQYGYDAERTFHNRAETRLTPANVHQLTLQWKSNEGTPSTAIVGPPLSKGGLFLACNSAHGLVARDQRNGELKALQLHPTHGPCFAPVLYGSSIIAEFWGLDGYHGALERFDSSGLLWSGASVDPEPLQTPALAGNTVYVREVSRRVHAFDAATGQVRWSTDMSWIDSDIAVAPSRVVLARHDSSDSYLQALDATTGQLAWSVTLDWQTTGEAPVIADGKVFVQQPNGKLRALDLQTGATAWELATERGSSVALAASGDTLYRASLDRLWALDLRTGGKRWKAAVPGGKVRSSNIVLANGVLYYMAKDPFVQGQRLLAVDAATGELLMRGPNAEVPGYNSRIIVADGLVQVVSSTDRGWMVVYGLDSAP